MERELAPYGVFRHDLNHVTVTVDAGALLLVGWALFERLQHQLGRPALDLAIQDDEALHSSTIGVTAWCLEAWWCDGTNSNDLHSPTRPNVMHMCVRALTVQVAHTPFTTCSQTPSKVPTA
jgi:hypothetical protein